LARAAAGEANMTAAERTRMREVLRAALGRAHLPGAEPEHPGRFQPPRADAGDLVGRFSTELTKLGGAVHEARSTEDVVGIIGGVLGGAPRPKLLSWDEQWLPVPGLWGALTAAGVTILTQAAATAATAAHRTELATADAGLTGADGGLAQTGSVVLASSPGRGRLASLLPPIHIALLERTQFYETLPDFISAHPDLVTRGANFVCITGPSRTADIEHVLARGVHGPKEVHVILVG
jgi:hypothetical protein